MKMFNRSKNNIFSNLSIELCIMSSIMFPEKADIYAGNNSTALFAVEMKEEGGGGREESEGEGEIEKK